MNESIHRFERKAPPGSELPSLITPLGSAESLMDALPRLRSVIEGQLATVGGVLLRGFDVPSIQSFRDFAAGFGHPLLSYGLPTGWEFWEWLDRQHLHHCDRMIVLTLEGWDESHGVRAEIERIVKDFLHYRRDTQPLAMPSAGCVFKNPPKDSAGRLIEAVGLKGARVGDAEVSAKHANFMVNRGGARAQDVLDLIGKVKRAVKQQAGVSLELELKIVGEA